MPTQSEDQFQCKLVIQLFITCSPLACKGKGGVGIVYYFCHCAFVVTTRTVFLEVQCFLLLVDHMGLGTNVLLLPDPYIVYMIASKLSKLRD